VKIPARAPPMKHAQRTQVPRRPQVSIRGLACEVGALGVQPGRSTESLDGARTVGFSHARGSMQSGDAPSSADIRSTCLADSSDSRRNDACRPLARIAVEADVGNRFDQPVTRHAKRRCADCDLPCDVLDWHHLQHGEVLGPRQTRRQRPIKAGLAGVRAPRS
jgi:hypothetical protein